MRFVLYNIRYGTGSKVHDFIRPSGKNLQRICNFLHEVQPDLVGLIEVDHGSYRTRGKNQSELLAEKLGHYHSHCVKYGEDSFWRRMPVLKNQGNAFLARDRIRNETFHYFDQGMKRLIIELELERLVVYLVHLSIGARTRHEQLNALYRLVRRTERPFLVAGDFNMLWGEREIERFLAATGLRNANRQRLPTYPSHRPSRHLDFVLHSKEISIRKSQVPHLTLSDHLPLIIDFDVAVKEERRAAQREPSCKCPDYENLKVVGRSRKGLKGEGLGPTGGKTSLR